MPWQYIFILLISVFISVALALFAWERRNSSGARPFYLMMGAMAYWTLAYIFEISSQTYSVKVFWLKMEYVGIIIVPVTWLLFALEYAGFSHLVTRRNIVFLSVIPALNLFMIWTDPLHHLFWKQINLAQTDSGSMLQNVNGVWFAAHAFYSYLLLFLGLVLLFWTAFQKTGFYRKQALTVAFGALVPLVANFFVVFGGNPLAPLDLTPFAFTISGIFIASSFLRYRFMDLLPIARGAVIESMEDAVLVLDVQNRIMDLNPAMEGLLGCPRKEILGKPAREALQDWPELIDTYREVFDIRAEISTNAPEGLYFDLRISPLHSQSQELAGRMIVLSDITERKKAEEALRAQKQLFENLVAVAHATIERPSLDATLRNVLNVSMGLTGAERGSLFLLDQDNRVTHSILARGEVRLVEQKFLVDRVMSRGLAGWVVRNQEAVLIEDVTKDSRWVALLEEAYQARSVLAVPVMGHIGSVGVLTLEHSRVAHFTDQHFKLIQMACDQMALALRNAQMFEDQRQLANREATLNRVLRAVGEHLDLQGALQVAVDTIAELTSWPFVAIVLPDEAQQFLDLLASGGSIKLQMSSQKVPIHTGILGRTYLTGQTQNVPNVHADPDYVAGNPEILSEVCVPLRRGKRILGVLDVESDQPTAFQANDVQLVELLGEAIALSLENAQLYDQMVHAKEQAEQANQAKSDFVSLVAHELKIPMTSISGYAALLSNGIAGAVSPQQDELLEIIRSNISRMATLVSDLTDISRIESGRVRLDPVPLDFANLVAEVTRSVQTETDRKGHRLQIDIPSDFPSLLADQARLGQILTNLFSNAIKYTPPGGQITLRAAGSELGSGMATISIADRGLGIKPAEREHIFTKFFRSEDEAVRAEPGTGLGLNITKLLVELQGGEIWFESTYGQGTTFFFTVPLVS